MTRVRDHLADLVIRKVERYGVVIWDDPKAAYREVVEIIKPRGATLCVFDGSWYALRHQVEPLLSESKPPSLLVYLPASRPPAPDPLEELRVIGTSYRIRLPTLLKQALKGQLTEKRIAQIGKQCSTLPQAEAALEGSASEVDARLLSITKETSPPAVAAVLIAGIYQAEITDLTLDQAVRNTLTESLGGDYGTREGDRLREAAFRHLTLTSIRHHLGKLPNELANAVAPSTASQRRTCVEAIGVMQNRPDLHHAYIAMANKTDQMLRLTNLLQWDASLVKADATPATEDLAFSAALRHINESEFSEASELADTRLARSWWVRPSSPDNQKRAARWRAIRALADLGRELRKPLPELASLEEAVDWYTNEGWTVDSLYRQSELINATSGMGLNELDDLFQQVRSQYREWLNEVLHLATAAAREVQANPTNMQRSVHRQYVAKAGHSCAYVLVDALRYELGRDLAVRLTSLKAQVATDAVIATPPTITRVGMAALLPDSETAFGVKLDGSDQLSVTIGKEIVSNVRDRVKRLEHAHGKVADLTLDEVAQSTNKTLRRNIAGAHLVLVRSTEIDRGGEADQLSAGWTIFDSTLNILQTAVAKLLAAGIQRIVITSDHGFLAVRQLGGEAKIDRPATGTGELHRRAWIGRGGTATDSTIKVPLADFGIASDLDIITPRGLGVFTAGGGLQFFHGGLSPQELIVPVITVTAEESPDEQAFQVALELAGKRITTGVFAVTVTMLGDLLTRRSHVRLQLIQNRQQIATVVGGDGVDTATKTIDAVAGSAQVIIMQVTADLQACSTASLEVLAAETGLRLGSIKVEVGASVIVEGRLD